MPPLDPESRAAPPKGAEGLREWKVPDSLGGTRADRVISALLGVSRSSSRRLIEAGLARSAVGRLKPSERVDARASLWLGDPPDRKLLPEPVDFEVVYQDDHLAVVVKPAGVITHPGTVAPTQSGTLAAGLLDRFPWIEGVGQPARWGIVHRLDRDTSGLLVTALSPLAYRKLGAALRSREVKRRYQAMVHGVMQNTRGAIEAPLGPDPRRRGKRAVVVDGRYALTHYRVARRFDHPPLSLLEVGLRTGRTHQIRVHLSSIGHPVVGDRLYSGRPDPLAAGRMWLHASELTFEHPADPAKKMEFRSALPDELRRAMEYRLGDGKSYSG